MKVAVFHPGTQHSWQTAAALQDLALLEFYATSIFYQPDRWPYRVERYLPAALRRRAHAEFGRFEHPALDPRRVKTYGLFEWLERLAMRAGLAHAAVRLDRLGNRRFSRHLEDEVRSARPFALWGFNSSSLETFTAGRAAGRYCILDRTIGDWRYYNAVMRGVFETHAEWFPQGRHTVDDYVIERNDAEYRAADLIVCGSAFCAETVRAHSPVAGLAAKLRVLPYCFDEALFANLPPPAPADPAGPVRFLFVGQVSPRKGIHHLLEAIAQIPRSEAELTVVGPMGVPREVFARFEDRVSYLPSVPRAEIPAIMARHHALVFPSYFEGSSLSLLEGLAAGLALVHTPQAGNGATADSGILLARPDTELTLAAMRRLIDDRAALARFRSRARAEAENYSFARYRMRIAALLAEAGLVDEEGGDSPAARPPAP
ncbi:MAG TPA: glycosyltransferase family 4 protein [Croceibacterium sp.]|nr:glycosyltransferase family 4 protein [Croceibacterium sp.]